MAEENDTEAGKDYGVMDTVNSLDKKRTPGSPSVSVFDLGSYVPEHMNARDRYLYQQQSGALPKETYFPSANNNIQKGSYSGGIVGNVPIYAAGSLYPFGIEDAREKQLHLAAMSRVAQEDKFMSFYTKVPETKNSAIQPKLNEEYMSGLQDWIGRSKKAYGNNWEQALVSNPQFQRFHQNAVTVAKEHDQLIGEVANVDKAIKDKDSWVTPEAVAISQKIKSGLINLHNTPEDIQGLVNQLQVYKDYGHQLDEIVDKSVPEIVSSISKNPQGLSGQGYNAFVVSETTKYNNTKLKEQAHSLKENYYKGYDGMTEDRIYNDLKSRVSDQTKKHLEIKEDPLAKEDIKKGFRWNNGMYQNDKFTFTVGTKDVPDRNVAAAMANNPNLNTENAVFMHRNDPKDNAEIEIPLMHGKNVDEKTGEEKNGMYAIGISSGKPVYLQRSDMEPISIVHTKDGRVWLTGKQKANASEVKSGMSEEVNVMVPYSKEVEARVRGEYGGFDYKKMLESGKDYITTSGQQNHASVNQNNIQSYSASELKDHGWSEDQIQQAVKAGKIAVH